MADQRRMRPDSYFFVGPHHATDWTQELAASWQAIAEKRKVGRHGELFACAFPARYQLLQEVNSQLPAATCPAFDEWLKLFSATRVYLVYSSSYPNNPASIFGHTFLRFDRTVGGDGETSSDLRGYSVAFMATVNPDDGPVIYLWKGLTGGYQGHLEIKPFYMSVGIYNNAEGRDLWEYPLPFSREKINFLLKHLWEISRQTGVDYYFFDQNCSWMMLTILEAVDEDRQFASKDHWLVVPQQTLWEIVNAYQIEEYHYRQSLVKKLAEKFQLLDWDQQRSFARARNHLESLQTIGDYRVLEVLALDWKYRNYRKKTHLNSKEKELYWVTHQRLAQAPIVESRETPTPVPSAPTNGHRLGKIRLQGDQLDQSVEISYGLHDWDDPPWGFPANSIINFLQARMVRRVTGRVQLERFQLIDIKSLENFSWFYPRWSWSAQAQLQAAPLRPRLEVRGGIAHRWQRWRFFWLTGPQLEPQQIVLQSQVGLAGWLTGHWFWHATSQVSYPNFVIHSEIFLQSYWQRQQFALGVGLLWAVDRRCLLRGSWYF